MNDGGAISIPPVVRSGGNLHYPPSHTTKQPNIPIMAVSAIGFCIFIQPLCATGEFCSKLPNSPVAHSGCIKISQNPIALTAIIGMELPLLCVRVGRGIHLKIKVIFLVKL